MLLLQDRVAWAPGVKGELGDVMETEEGPTGKVKIVSIVYLDKLKDNSIAFHRHNYINYTVKYWSQ